MTTEPGTTDRTTTPAAGRAPHRPRLGVEAEAVDSRYLAERQLRTGTAGWVLLAGLGVSAVISGDYAGWNFGLAEGGFGGLLIATVLMAVMYGAMVLGLAELGSALPTAGGGYTFARLAVAVLGLVVFLAGAIPSFDSANLLDIAPTDAAGASSFLPYGLLGVWAAFPFAIWFFLAVESVPLAAEEARDPAKAMPRGILAAMGLLVVLALLMLVFTPGAAGSALIAESGNPPVDALAEAGRSDGLTTLVNYAGLVGLVASFFSIIYAYSRQTFALSRAGYLPRRLSVTNSRKAPVLALLVPGALGFVLSLTGQGAMLLNMAVFGATVSYVLMMVSHIVLRRREPDLPRPYRTPGGTATTGVALVLAAAAVVATFLVDLRAALWTLVAYAAFLAYFGLYSRHHLVASAPEEEFEALAVARQDVR